MWNDKQVLSEAWIQASTQPHFGNDAYGYHWRLMQINTETCYYATGFGVQRMYVFPQLNLVVTMVQQHYRSMPEGDRATRNILNEIIESIGNH